MIIAYTAWQQRNAPRRPRTAPAPVQAVQPPAGEAAPRAAAPSRGPDIPKAVGEPVRVETNTVFALISRAGGSLLSWRLKPHPIPGTTEFEEMVPLRSGYLLRSGGLEGPLSVKLSDFPARARWPAKPDLASLNVSGEGIEQRLAGPGQTPVVLPVAKGRDVSGAVEFTQELPGGRRLRRRLTLPADGYVARLDLELTGPLPEHLDLVWFPGVGYSPNEEEAVNRSPTFMASAEAVMLNREDVHVIGERSSPQAQTGRRPFWTAVKSKYFVAALVPPDPDAPLPAGVRDVLGLIESRGTLARSGFLPFGGKVKQPDNLLAGLRYVLDTDRDRVRISTSLYIGPQSPETLETAGSRLIKASSLGWFRSIGMAMMRLLNFFFVHVRNYGLAIILLTLTVKLILLVPTQWGMNRMKVHTKRMQAIQPQVNFLSEQYKDDPKRKQEETLRLFRDHKVNPAGMLTGCLPLFLQMPVFIALYNVLRVSVELRGADFLWIDDLSAKDPYYILIGLVGFTMWLQQALSPQVGDPQQAKMMRWLFPIMFTVMFINFPAGFLLYFLVQNLVSIVQQWYTNRFAGAVEARRT